ncbi:PEP-CTERM sorting domain-containing protein [Luteolibacter luteus]|uniref:PEP-CTERM sorting domain-containing protein n=1 Tax=Luteolibacter luteus TaxID=2728835 RepID=A0A858RSY0_9BACT|nr:PEP-CTERM sorting domain-containing protein [Luteolibacter luteus]QJE99103.1 PEP-CTERM sorting domain-containing protein [Luteolibacter luteus]
MNKLTSSSSALALGLAGFLSLVTAADAALTMTINTWDRTYSFSGSFTTAYIPLNGGNGSPFFYIGTGIGTTGYGMGMGDILTVGTSSTGEDGYDVGFSHYLPSGIGVALSGEEPGTLEILSYLGEIVVFDGEGNGVLDVPPGAAMSWTLTGNGWIQPMSPGSLPEYEAFLPTLDGAPLYLFQGTNPSNIVSAVMGQVVLVPEPSSALLLLGSSGLLLRRRRVRS